MSNAPEPSEAPAKGRPSRERAGQVAARRAEAIKLRLLKVDWQTITDKLGYSSPRRAREDVQRALRGRADELRDQADNLRMEELATLDMLESKILTRAMSGDLGAVDRVLRIKAHRAKLAGLEAPKTVELTVPEITDQVRALVDALVPPDPDDPDDDENEEEPREAGDRDAAADAG